MLSKEQLARLENDGFVVIKNVFNPSCHLDPILEEMTSILDNLARELHQNGQIASLYQDRPFGKRLTRIIAETGQSHSQHFDFSLPKGQVGATAPMYLGQALFRLITNTTLLDCVQDAMGPEIYSNPVQHVRLKPPEAVVPKKVVGMSVLVGETPWHQDNAVLTQDADATNVLTVWIPLVDATIENGCLIVIPGSHRDSNLSAPQKNDNVGNSSITTGDSSLASTLAQHCPTQGGALRIPDSIIDCYRDTIVPVPVKRGDILMFHRRLMHASLPNMTDDLRSSLDLRYQPLGQPTGRDVFPGFVVRSSTQKVLESRDEWERLWKETQKRMSSENYKEQPFDRWKADHPMCA